MRLLRSFPVLSFALVLLSIVGVSIAQRSVGLLLVAGALAAISWYLTEGPRGRSLPKWVSNVLVIAVSLNVIVDVMQNQHDVLGVLGRFTLWLTIIKLYERRTARDHAHLLVLSMLLMLTGCMMSTDLFFGVVLAMYIVLGLYVLLLYQLHASHERVKLQRQASVPENYRMAPMLRPISGQHLSLHFRSLVLGVAVLGFALGMVVFVLFPRGIGEGAVYGMPSPSRDQRPGFVDEVDLIRGGRITDSRRAVMSVQFLDDQGRPFMSAEPLLLRGAVLDRYNGRGRWQAAAGATVRFRSGPDHLSRFVASPLHPREASQDDAQSSRFITQQFDVLHDTNVMFTMYAPVAVRTDRDQTIEFDRNSLAIKQRRNAPRLSRYTVHADLTPTDDLLQRLAAPPAISSGTLRRLENASVRELAVEVLDRAGLPTSPPESTDREAYWQWSRSAAHALQRHLHSSEYHYTTDLSGLVVPRSSSEGPVDPIVLFLQDFKRGHCEYFAAAFVSLCYNIGIEARMVTGYVAYEFDAASQRYNVVESNAHAWTEVRVGEQRWATFDPTPVAVLRELHQADVGMADRLRWFYDNFDGAWGRTVVEFDRDQQTRLAESGWTATWSERASRSLESLRGWMDRVNRAFYLGPAGYIYMAFVACVIVFVVLVLIKLMRRSFTMTRLLRLQHLRGREYQRMLRQLGFYMDMLRVLQRAGVGKPHWQPPRLHAQLLHERNPDAAGIVRTLTDLFYAARYGGETLSKQQLAEAHAKVSELAGALAGGLAGGPTGAGGQRR